MSVSDRLFLRKRAIIETVNDELKNIAQVEHSGHRCSDNFIVNLLGAIAAYCLFTKNPCINVKRTIDTQLALFWIRRTHVDLEDRYRNTLYSILFVYSIEWNINTRFYYKVYTWKVVLEQLSHLNLFIRQTNISMS